MFAEEERSLVVPRDDKPFVISESDFVRLSGRGISGSNIEAKVEGPAKILVTNNIRDISDGQMLIGSFLKEFELKPSGKGRVKVTITVTSPIPDTKPVVRKIEFQVQ